MDFLFSPLAIKCSFARSPNFFSTFRESRCLKIGTKIVEEREKQNMTTLVTSLPI